MVEKPERPFNHEEIAAALVDPDMLAIAIEELVAQLDDRGPEPDEDGADLDVLSAAAAALAASDPDLAASAEEDEAARNEFVVTCFAIGLRMKALMDLSEAGHLRKWEPKKTGLDDLHPAIYEAACLCRLLSRPDGSTGFQLLEFLGHAARAEKELGF